MVDETSPNKKHGKGWLSEETHQHAKAAHQEMKKSLEALFPPEFIEHRRQARKEMLLAWRSVIDAALKHLDER